MRINGKDVPVLGILLAAGGSLLGWLSGQIMSAQHDKDFEQHLTENYIMIPKKEDRDAK